MSIYFTHVPIRSVINMPGTIEKVSLTVMSFGSEKQPLSTAGLNVIIDQFVVFSGGRIVIRDDYAACVAGSGWVVAITSYPMSTRTIEYGGDDPLTILTVGSDEQPADPVEVASWNETLQPAVIAAAGGGI